MLTTHWLVIVHEVTKLALADILTKEGELTAAASASAPAPRPAASHNPAVRPSILNGRGNTYFHDLISCYSRHFGDKSTYLLSHNIILISSVLAFPLSHLIPSYQQQAQDPILTRND
jgi:hypothetical protein